VNEADALRMAIEAGRTRTFIVSLHAFRDSMRTRNVSDEDIRSALMTAKRATKETPTKFKITGGVDRDGDDLSVVIVFEWHTKIVTVF
jgi:hypothetical protein